MDLPATQLLNDDDDSLLSQSLNSSQITPGRVRQVANLCIGNKKYPLFRGINKIGRDTASDVYINDLSVSRNHAEIEIKRNCYYICDLRSSNKTRIDNESLRPDRFYQILDGSKLTFGIINAQFLLLRDSNDSIIVPETPARGLKLRYDGNKSSVTDSDDSVVLGTQEAKDEAVFAKPTSLPIRSPSTRDARANARRKLNASIHDLETQRQSEKNNDPSIFDRETQQVDNSNKKKSIYDVETQQVGENSIKNDVFDLATQRLPEEAEGESDIYAMNTQQISTTDNRGIYDLETQKISVKDQASNLYDLATQQIAADDDIYDCETQRINKQFEITKSKFKKSRAPNKSPVVNKTLPTAPRRNCEEADRRQKHVSTIVDDSETDDELVDEIQSKQSSSVHQSSSGVTNISKKSKDNDRTPSVSVNAHHHIIAETDDESETDDEEAVINQDSEINGRSKIDDKQTFKDDAVKDSETDDEEEVARIQDKEQSNVHNDSDPETHDEISPSGIPSCVISVDKNKILNRGVDSEAESNACPSPVLVDFSKIQHPGSEQNYHDDDDDETDDDEVYMTPNQLVSPHRKVASKTEQPGLERFDTAPSVSAEPAAAVSPLSNELECDPDALTQVIPLNTNACKKVNNVEDHEVCDEFAPTQLVNPQNNFKDDDDETDDEESESLCREADDKNNQASINGGKINKVNQLMTCDQDLNDAPTQLLNLETQKLQGGIEETQKLVETQRDDLESTQLIDSQAIFSTINKTEKNSPQVAASKNKTNDDSLDSIDLENAPTQVINFESSKNACEPKNDNLDDNSPVIKSDGISRRASSTPLSSGKRKMNFTAVKNCRVSLDKLQDVDDLNSDEKKKVNHDKKKEFKSNDKLNSDSHNDSLVRNLDAMFGGSNDDELEEASPLQTQQLEEILNDVPEKLHNVNNFQKPGSQENKINLSNKKISESQVDSGPDTQEAYFARLSSRKKKSNILVDSQGSSSSQKSVKSQGKAAKKIVYAPGITGFSNGVPIEGSESVPVYESPEKKFKTKSEEKGAKPENGKKQTVNPVNDDDFFAGLPDVRVAGTDANPSNSTLYSSDSEDDYSSGNVVQKLKKSMAKIKAMAKEDDDGIFSNSKIIPNSSFSHTDIKLPKLKSIDDDDSSSDGLEKVGGGNRNKKKIQVKEEVTSKVADRKSTRKRVLPQKLKSGSFVIDDDGVLNDGQDHMVSAKRPRTTRKNSESINSSVAEKAQAESKKAAAKRSKKVNDDQSLLGSLASSGTEDQKAGVEAKKKNLAKQSKSNKIDVEQSLLSASVSSSNKEHSTEAKKKTATKRTKKVAADQTNFDSSTSSTASSSTLNSTIVSKRPRASVVESPSTSARSRHSHRPTEMQYKIMFTGIDYERHEQAVQSLGGVISNDPMTGTILITDKVRRTLKFLCAISRGIPIVSENWITASIKRNKFIDTDHYILHDSAAEAKFGFNLKQSLIKSKEKSLLHNLTFVITPGVNQPSFNDLKNMIQVAGGKALARAPKTWTNSYILSCEADLPKVKKLKVGVPNGVKVPVVTTEFLLSGILKQELNAEEHKLSS